MKKVVYNRCHGGFGLSKEAVKWMADRGHVEANQSLEDHDRSGPWYDGMTVDRHDALLVMAVEALGSKANGECAELSVHTLTSNRYYIDEYDGSESVVEPHTIHWTEV